MMLIYDRAGMNKSTVLTRLSKQNIPNFLSKWVVRIYFNDHTVTLKAMKEEQMDTKKENEFASVKMLKVKPSFELELFK